MTQSNDREDLRKLRTPREEELPKEVTKRIKTVRKEQRPHGVYTPISAPVVY
jgi:hypothetical protein